MNSLGNLLQQHKQKSLDKRVFGLVIQGGGMRAVYSCAAACELLRCGFAEVFDHVIGSSSGSLNAVYFMGQDELATTLYTVESTTKQFVNLLRKDKKLNVDYIIDVVLKQRRPINIDLLRSSQSKLHTILTDADDGSKKVLSEHFDYQDIYEELRAACAMPILYNKRVYLNGKYYVDGGVSDLVPIDVAIDLGCTDIVVLMTQQLKYYQFNTMKHKLSNRIIQSLVRGELAGVKDTMPTNETSLKLNLDYINQSPPGVRIYTLEPSNKSLLVPRTSIDKPKLESLANMGSRDMQVFLKRHIID